MEATQRRLFFNTLYTPKQAKHLPLEPDFKAVLEAMKGAAGED